MSLFTTNPYLKIYNNTNILILRLNRPFLTSYIIITVAVKTFVIKPMQKLILGVTETDETDVVISQVSKFSRVSIHMQSLCIETKPLYASQLKLIDSKLSSILTLSTWRGRSLKNTQYILKVCK